MTDDMDDAIREAQLRLLTTQAADAEFLAKHRKVLAAHDEAPPVPRRARSASARGPRGSPSSLPTPAGLPRCASTLSTAIALSAARATADACERVAAAMERIAAAVEKASST